jgi:septin 7
MSKVPFAVVGANSEITSADGRKVRGRKYPWGIIEVDNEEHCDFVKLRQMLIRTHMEELKEHTNNALYENYRSEKLTAMGVAQDPSVFKEVNPAVKQEEERTLHEQKLAKMEAEMKMVFQQKVAEKESKLKQSEEELYARHREMKEQLERQRMELEEKKSESRVEDHWKKRERGRDSLSVKPTVPLHRTYLRHSGIDTTNRHFTFNSCLFNHRSLILCGKGRRVGEQWEGVMI